MSFMKDLWLQEWEAEYNECIDAGFTERHAQIAADNNANDRSRERLADMADTLRQRAKDGLFTLDTIELKEKP